MVSVIVFNPKTGKAVAKMAVATISFTAVRAKYALLGLDMVEV